MASVAVNFTGLCCFVPNTDLSKRARVVMVDARRSHGTHDPAHEAVIVTLRDSFIGGGWPKVPFESDDGLEMYYFPIHSYDIRFDGAQDGNLNVVGWGQPVSHCPDANNDSWFSWVASMAVINKPSSGSVPFADIDDALLGDSSVPSDVSARMRLSQGSLQCLAFAADEQAGKIKWRFKKENGDDPLDHRQALCEEVAFFADLPAGDVKLFRRGPIHDSNPKEDPDPLILRRQNLTIFVANMPLSQIKKRKYGTVGFKSSQVVDVSKEEALREVERPAIQRKKDHHFERFYSLLRGDNHKSLRIPHPDDICCESSGPNADTPKCPPVAVNPNSNA